MVFGARSILAKVCGCEYYESFEPDVLMRDGDVITLGNTEVTVLSTPGHTDGTVSFFFDVHDSGKTYRAGMHGGVGFNTLSREFLAANNIDFSMRTQFLYGLERLMYERVDVFIGNHTWNNDTVGKYKRSLTENSNPFINPNEWREFLEGRKSALLELMRNEQ